MGLVLNGGDLIKTTKSHMRSTCQKLKSQMPTVKVKESCTSCASQFSQLRQLASDPQISLVRGFFSVTYLPITHIIYTLITYKNCQEPIERKTLREVSTTHPPCQRKSYSFLKRNLYSLFSFPLPLLYPLRGDLYPNTIHIHSKC